MEGEVEVVVVVERASRSHLMLEEMEEVEVVVAERAYHSLMMEVAEVVFHNHPATEGVSHSHLMMMEVIADRHIVVVMVRTLLLMVLYQSQEFDVLAEQQHILQHLL
ncbi:hypothetical protein KIN20_001101 [Parelaphostrongylus tenuis]|uniref:Uncharacterized protein n=1 Tax=Parelaphostrongylus tenuis TaxID=148309 RepID=A0AAD5MEA8_PARTN|nr:hypothetical protein KIN20_001101 [Parelaphostrongylus tenuis]